MQVIVVDPAPRAVDFDPAQNVESRHGLNQTLFAWGGPAQEGSMRPYAVFCVIGCFMLVLSEASRAAGIEAAASAERAIASCQDKGPIFSAACLNDKLNRQWVAEFVGKTFNAVGEFEGVKQSVLGNFFAFVSVAQYRVSCKITKQSTASLANIADGQTVIISGVVEGYRLSFNLQSLHHLRLVPYCLVAAAI